MLKKLSIPVMRLGYLSSMIFLKLDDDPACQIRDYVAFVGFDAFIGGT